MVRVHSEALNTKYLRRFMFSFKTDQQGRFSMLKWCGSFHYLSCGELAAAIEETKLLWLELCKRSERVVCGLEACILVPLAVRGLQSAALSQ